MKQQLSFLAKYMEGRKLHLLTLLLGFYSVMGFGQTFTNSTGQNLSGTYSPYVTSCPAYNATNVKSVAIDVSSIGTLTNDGTNELLEVRLSLNGGNRGITNTNMLCYLKAPTGECILLYNGSGSNYTQNTVTSNYVFKNSSNSCLNITNIYP